MEGLRWKLEIGSTKPPVNKETRHSEFSSLVSPLAQINDKQWKEGVVRNTPKLHNLEGTFSTYHKYQRVRLDLYETVYRSSTRNVLIMYKDIGDSRCLCFLDQLIKKAKPHLSLFFLFLHIVTYRWK